MGLGGLVAMRVQKKYTMRTLMKNSKTAIIAFSILGVTLPFMSCSGTSQGHYGPAPGTPPSFENDMGRPEVNEKIFNRSRGLF